MASLRPSDPPEADGFARHHAGNCIALGHAVGVHDPGHGLRVGVDVRSGNILLRPDDRQNRAGVAARHPFQFALGHCFRIAGDSALGSAEGNVHHRALPRHPRGQRLHFVERDLRMKADATLGRSAHRAVLHAVARKAVNVAVVHAHRHAHRQHALRILDHLARILFEAHGVCRGVEVLHGDVIGVCLIRYCCWHWCYLLAWAAEVAPSLSVRLPEQKGWDASPAFAQAKLVSSTRAALWSDDWVPAYTGSSHLR